MKGNVVDIYKAFDGSDRRLVIPIYQRNYDWSEKQCARLFDDLLEMIAAGRPKHFFGAVVGKPEDSFTWVVIDGQQRLTTVSLLMLALAHAIKAGEIPEVDHGDQPVGLADKLLNNYLLIKNNGTTEIKLIPVNNDEQAYRGLFAGPAHFDEKSKITANYRYFRSRLKTSPDSAKTLWDQGICQLEVMLLDLEAQDDPQRIFESLNSTGLALKEADKIRNLVLMGLQQGEQGQLYRNFWQPLEQNVNFETDRYIRWYLVAKTGKTPLKNAIFEDFKRFARKSGNSITDIVKELHLFSVYDKELSTATTGIAQVDQVLRRANMILGDVVKPFLYLTYRDLKAAKITAADFAQVVKIVETYLFRRFVAGIPTNSLDTTFATAYFELRKLRGNEPYAQVLAYLLTSKTRNRRFPQDPEFSEHFRTRDFYHARAYRDYLFHCLEVGNSLDVKDIAEYLHTGLLTIEHIMPQTLTDNWRQELGPEFERIHDTWLHRIGNLTITGYNSQYSNLSFTEKLHQKDGFLASPYRLNNYLKQQSSWSESQMQQRTKELYSRALEIWSFPVVNFTPKKPMLQMLPLGTEESFTGTELAAVAVNGTKANVKSWVDGVAIVLRELLRAHRERLLNFAAQEDLLETENVTQLAAQNKQFREIDPALAVKVNNATSTKTALLRRVCAAIGFDPEEIYFYLAASKEGQTTAEQQTQEQPASPYADLQALVPFLLEVADSNLEPAETTDLQQEFFKALAPHQVKNAPELLGGQAPDQFLATHPPESLSIPEILACLTGFRLAVQFMSDAVHRELLNGRIAALIQRLP